MTSDAFELREITDKLRMTDRCYNMVSDGDALGVLREIAEDGNKLMTQQEITALEDDEYSRGYGAGFAGSEKKKQDGIYKRMKENSNKTVILLNGLWERGCAQNTIRGKWWEDDSNYEITCDHQAIADALIGLQNQLAVQYAELKEARDKLRAVEAKTQAMGISL